MSDACTQIAPAHAKPLTTGNFRHSVRKRRWIASADPYLDTVVMWLPYLAKGIMKAIYEVQGRWTIPQMVHSEDYRHGVLLPVHQVRRDALPTLEDIRIRHRGTLHRVDIAYDFEPRNMTDEALHVWLMQSIMLRWRIGHMLERGPTLSWTKQTGRRRRSNRDLMLYRDRPSKLTGAFGVNHLELKNYNTRACKRSGWWSFTDLAHINPAAVFERHVKLASFDREIAKQKFVRSFAVWERLAADRLWHRSHFDRVQHFYDEFPHQRSVIKSQSVSLLRLPDQLAWGAQKLHFE